MNNYWDESKYQNITEVQYKENTFFVRFANKDVVSINTESILVERESNINWEAYSFNNYEIVIPHEPNNIEIPWNKIRLLSDEAFSRHVATIAEANSRKVGSKLKLLREKSNVKSKDLAKRTGLTPQTISRIENGKQDVGFSTLRKILASMGYNLKDLEQQELKSELESQVRDLDFLISKVSNLGFSKEVFKNKVISKSVYESLIKNKKNGPSLLLNEVANYCCRIFNCSIQDIWSDTPLEISNLTSKVYYKSPLNANSSQVKAYSHYAFYLAKIVLKSTPVRRKKYPKDIDEFMNNYYKHYNSIDLNSLTQYVWDLGICVLPLNDKGLFHGASWNIDGKHIIILKQATESHARWIFDLLHELYHVFAHLQEENTTIIESEEITHLSNSEIVEELEANSFANQVLFNKRAHEITERCINEADWKVENLKRTIVKIAQQENIREDVLANYLAYRLGYQNLDWWGVASGFQVKRPKPYNIVVEVLKKEIEMNNLHPVDYNLLLNALN